MFQPRGNARDRALHTATHGIAQRSSSSSTHVDESETMPSLSNDVSDAIPVCIVTKNDTLSFK